MNKLTKSIVIVALAISSGLSAQDGSNSNYVRFTNDQRQYNDWSVSLRAGFPWLQSADLTSISNGASDKWLVGYDFGLEVEKQINHSFGIILGAQFGKTKQENGSEIKGKTEYMGIYALGDLKLSSLFRRIDNRSEYKWGLHAYAGAGILGYKAYNNFVYGEMHLDTKQKLGLNSVYGQFGAGVSYKINPKFDVDFRAMYVVTGDEAFDGSGNTGPISELHPGGKSDNFITTTFGVKYKLGTHDEHLAWIDPLQELFNRPQGGNEPFCKSGDADGDGVCDDWDLELDTPAGARVDVKGRAIDTDLDGVPDYLDKCVTIPGPPENDGCPVIPDATLTADEITKIIKGIQFELNSAEIKGTESKSKLDAAAKVLTTYEGTAKFMVEGHTDSRGSEPYNLKLSQKRAESVIQYLIGQGVKNNILTPVGKGYSEPKFDCKPATKCEEWKNLENRRVVFKVDPASV